MSIIENLYDILQVDRNADEKEIKRAYVKMLRKYPPEKAPEEFKKIRGAYERLIDAISRAEYDAFYQYKDQIDAHDSIGSEALENEDYKTAIKEYKKILIIEPTLTFAKNMLGLALAYDEQYNMALIQFKELIKINPSNATYYGNLAYVYKGKVDYDKAEEVYLKAYKLDPINDNIILGLSDLYIKKKQYDKAILFLKSCIGKNISDDFQDFIYYFEMVNVYTFSDNTKMIELTIDEIEKIIPNENEAREYVAWKFGKLAYDLYEEKLYSLSEKISRRAIEIDSSNESIKVLHNDAKELKEVFDLYDILIEDERILGPIKGPIYYYLYSDEYDEDEFKENYDKNIAAIESYVEEDFVSVIKSIDILKKEYALLYNHKREIYDDIYRMSQGNKRCYDQLYQLDKDTSVANGIIRLVSLWLTKDLSVEKRKEYFEDIIKEIDYENNYSIIKSVDRLKSNYSELYKLNTGFLEELKFSATKNSNLDKISSNTNSNNYDYNNSNTTTNNNYKSSSGSSSGGCGAIVICGIIGAFILPGIGFFVGAFIGYIISRE